MNAAEAEALIKARDDHWEWCAHCKSERNEDGSRKLCDIGRQLHKRCIPIFLARIDAIEPPCST